MDEVELYFRVKDLECEVNTISCQIDRLTFEREKLLYELDQLSQLEREKESEEVPEEVKPKKLKKDNGKPSQNNIEVQLQEGRS